MTFVNTASAQLSPQEDPNDGVWIDKKDAAELDRAIQENPLLEDEVQKLESSLAKSEEEKKILNDQIDILKQKVELINQRVEIYKEAFETQKQITDEYRKLVVDSQKQVKQAKLFGYTVGIVGILLGILIAVF